MKNIITITLLLSLYLYSCNNKDNDNIELINSYKIGALIINGDTKRIIFNLKYNASDFNSKVNPQLTSLVEKIDSAFNSMIELVDDTLSSIVQINNELVLLKSFQRKLFQEIIQIENISLSKNILKRIDSCHYLMNNFKISIIENVELFRNKLKYDFIIIENFMLNILFDLSEAPPTRDYFELFPIISPLQNLIKQGDKFEALIGIGPHNFKFLPNEVKLIVDGVEIHFNEGKYAKYVTEPLDKEKTITISLYRLNKQTNKFEAECENLEYYIKFNDQTNSHTIYRTHRP